MSQVKEARSLGPRDRRMLLAAIGHGRVYRTGGRNWRRTGNGKHGIVAGGLPTGKVPVARRHLDELVGDGLVRLGPSDQWELTYAGTIEAGAA